MKESRFFRATVGPERKKGFIAINIGAMFEREAYYHNKFAHLFAEQIAEQEDIELVYQDVEYSEHEWTANYTKLRIYLNPNLTPEHQTIWMICELKCAHQERESI